MTLPRPKGWDFYVNSLNEWQWRPPDQPDFGYVLRVEQVLSNRRSISGRSTTGSPSSTRTRPTSRSSSQTDDSLHFTFVTSNHLRHGYLTWLDLTGSDNAQVEIAVTGRKVDDAGHGRPDARVAAGCSSG